MVVGRKGTGRKHDVSMREPSSYAKESKEGYFIENKNLSFNALGEVGRSLQALARQKKMPRRKEEQLSPRENNTGRPTKLPTLARVERSEFRLPSVIRNKISGSVLRSNEGELTREIRNNVMAE